MKNMDTVIKKYMNISLGWTHADITCYQLNFCFISEIDHYSSILAAEIDLCIGNNQLSKPFKPSISL